MYSEWALLLPAYSVILVLLTYFVYFALAIYRTPSFHSMATMTGMSHMRCRLYVLEHSASQIPGLTTLPLTQHRTMQIPTRAMQPRNHSQSFTIFQ